VNKKILYIILILTLISCNPQKNKDKDFLPGVDIPISKMNSVIILSPSLGMEDIFTSTGLLSLEVENMVMVK